jgi:hypothetical protein
VVRINLLKNISQRRQREGRPTPTSHCFSSPAVP